MSRHTDAYVRIPDPFGPAAPVEVALDRLIRRHAIRAIVPCYDATVARLRSLSLGLPTVPVLDAALDRVTDKVALAETCRLAGARYPETWPAADAPDPAAAGPLVVKPRQTAIATPHRVITRTGASVATTTDELDLAVADIRGVGLEAIVQPRVDRLFKVNVSLVRRDGRTGFRIAYRVLHEYPPHGGLAATIESLDATEGVGGRALETAERVLDAAGYAGLANVEFYGQRDGELCLIEVNARVWGSLAFPEELGLEPTARAVADALGEPARAPLPYPPGRRFHRPLLEAQWLLSRSPERGARRALIGSIRPGDVVDVLSARDPVPAVWMALRLARTGAGMLKARIPRAGR
jgi:predicted ATP-grasp superfamily ATP-dependent carboligase